MFTPSFKNPVSAACSHQKALRGAECVCAVTNLVTKFGCLTKCEPVQLGRRKLRALSWSRKFSTAKVLTLPYSVKRSFAHSTRLLVGRSLVGSIEQRQFSVQTASFIGGQWGFVSLPGSLNPLLGITSTRRSVALENFFALLSSFSFVVLFAVACAHFKQHLIGPAR